MGKKKIIIGSRDSKLAVMQTELVMEQIRRCNQDLELELITLKTTGDLILDKTLDKIGGKGLFVKELDQALMDGRIDIAIHSLKDMPMELNEDLPIVALPKRGDARDALVIPQGETLESYDINKLISKMGSSSNRRKLQLEKIYIGAEIIPVRGNIITRLAKLDRGEYSSIILAAAGLHRVGLENRISRYFSVDEMIPAAGQGILSVQARRDLDVKFLNEVNNMESTYCATAERGFVRVLDGGCSSPIAAHARVYGNEIKLVGLHYNESTKEHIIGSITGDVLRAEALGENLAERLRGEIG
ncbi:Porphobilinogen deaminase [uncultured Clostridium sp.]|uniref:hydroxymethylbilane synthase n=1 Tax=uncultured Clostridium sp. TaxID=59620 RepID=UPI000822A33C|nr:hydroxymethylbilane synthase [uncultured Clostridium sp.]SCI91366.1 Porphobilinogen deaminase [uncultured Clostridium sp.]